MNRAIALVAMISGLGTIPLFAQVSGSADPSTSNLALQPFVSAGPGPAMATAESDDLGSRMARLEAENRRMQAELAAMRGETAQPPVAAVKPGGHGHRRRSTDPRRAMAA